MKRSDKTIPASALCFAGDVTITSTADGRRDFSGVAYSGGIIKNHWMWGDVAFDLATTSVPKKLPILLDHDNGKIAGQSAQIDLNGAVTVRGKLSGKTDAARHVAELADEEFPWQMSVRIHPGRVQQLSKGEVVAVNGADVTGPASIFRDSVIREISFTSVGQDMNTSAQVFSADDNLTVAIEQEEPDMNELEQEITALKAENAALKASNDEMKSAAEAAQKAEREAAVKTLFADVKREFKAEEAAAYIGMTAEQFSAVAKDMRALHAAKPQLPGHLFTEIAQNGSDAGEMSADTFGDYVDSYKKARGCDTATAFAAVKNGWRPSH